MIFPGGREQPLTLVHHGGPQIAFGSV